jgi:hypothetical protein
LRVSIKHLHNEIVQAVVEQLLERPGKLTIFDFALMERNLIAMLDTQAFTEIDGEHDTAAARLRRKAEQGMVVARQFFFDFFAKTL